MHGRDCRISSRKQAGIVSWGNARASALDILVFGEGPFHGIGTSCSFFTNPLLYWYRNYMTIDWYREFVDLDYTPADDEIVCLFYFEPAAGISMEEAAGRIASESSTGTWTTLFTLPPRMKALQATAFSIEKNFVKIAYPLALWEEGNAVQLLSGIAGNIFGMKAIANLRLIDATLPPAYLKHFRGPHYGNDGIRKMMGINGRPLTGAVPKPKIGFSAKEHAEIGYETWMGGFDFVKDDENLTSTSFNRFNERVEQLTRLRDRAEAETGEKKSAFLNITADVGTMMKRADLLAEYGWNYAMIDVVVAGTAGTMTMRDYCSDLGLAIHAHRAMHAAFDRNKKHGMTMYFLAKADAAHRGLADPHRDCGREAVRHKEGVHAACRSSPGEQDRRFWKSLPRAGLGDDEIRVPGLFRGAAPRPCTGRAGHIRDRTCTAGFRWHPRAPEGDAGRGESYHAGDRSMAGGHHAG